MIFIPSTIPSFILHCKASCDILPFYHSFFHFAQLLCKYSKSPRIRNRHIKNCRLWKTDFILFSKGYYCTYKKLSQSDHKNRAEITVIFLLKLNDWPFIEFKIVAVGLDVGCPSRALSDNGKSLQFWILIHYRLYTERRSASETATREVPGCNCWVQSIKRECCMSMWKDHLIFAEISQIIFYCSKLLIAGNYCFSCNSL